MNKKPYIPVFLICLVFVFVIIILSRLGILNGFSTAVQNIFFPIGNFMGKPFTLVTQNSESKEIASLRQENLILQTQIAEDKNILSDNNALRDQFKTTNVSSQNLLPAEIVGIPNTIPNFTFPESLILGEGKSNGVETGQAVLYKNNIVGEIVSVSNNFSKVGLVANSSSRFSGKDINTGSVGVIRGEGGGQMILDNVLSSQSLKVGDNIVSNGSEDLNGLGYAPGLVVGKITDISKNPSNLFQTASIKSLLNFNSLTVVFIKTK